MNIFLILFQWIILKLQLKCWQIPLINFDLQKILVVVFIKVAIIKNSSKYENFLLSSPFDYDNLYRWFVFKLNALRAENSPDFNPATITLRGTIEIPKKKLFRGSFLHFSFVLVMRPKIFTLITLYSRNSYSFKRIWFWSALHASGNLKNPLSPENYQNETILWLMLRGLLFFCSSTIPERAISRVGECLTATESEFVCKLVRPIKVLFYLTVFMTLCMLVY